jgi:DNA (cytosine-5)-methyltransferase 1
MRVLHLFAGGGGGILADLILGHRCIGAVEWEPAAQQVLAARQADGSLPPFPIFGDVRAFVERGYARSYRGMADCVAGGFPCQPFSVAGKRDSHADECDMAPAFLDVVRQVRPRLVFAENVPGLLTAHGADGDTYLRGFFGRLAGMGYDARWGVLGADDAGAPHRRKRLWIVGRRVAESDGAGTGQRPE